MHKEPGTLKLILLCLKSISKSRTRLCTYSVNRTLYVNKVSKIGSMYFVTDFFGKGNCCIRKMEVKYTYGHYYFFFICLERILFQYFVLSRKKDSLQYTLPVCVSSMSKSSSCSSKLKIHELTLSTNLDYATILLGPVIRLVLLEIGIDLDYFALTIPRR